MNKYRGKKTKLILIFLSPKNFNITNFGFWKEHGQGFTACLVVQPYKNLPTSFNFSNVMRLSFFLDKKEEKKSHSLFTYKG